MQLWFSHSFQWGQQQVLTEVRHAGCGAGLHGRHICMDAACRIKAMQAYLPWVGRGHRRLI